jgi:hypothetical protein
MVHMCTCMTFRGFAFTQYYMNIDISKDAAWQGSMVVELASCFLGRFRAESPRWDITCEFLLLLCIWGRKICVLLLRVYSSGSKLVGDVCVRLDPHGPTNNDILAKQQAQT